MACSSCSRLSFGRCDLARVCLQHDLPPSSSLRRTSARPSTTLDLAQLASSAVPAFGGFSVSRFGLSSLRGRRSVSSRLALLILACHRESVGRLAEEAPGSRPCAAGGGRHVREMSKKGSWGEQLTQLPAPVAVVSARSCLDLFPCSWRAVALLPCFAVRSSHRADRASACCGVLPPWAPVVASTAHAAPALSSIGGLLHRDAFRRGAIVRSSSSAVRWLSLVSLRFCLRFAYMISVNLRSTPSPRDAERLRGRSRGRMVLIGASNQLGAFDRERLPPHRHRSRRRRRGAGLRSSSPRSGCASCPVALPRLDRWRSFRPERGSPEPSTVRDRHSNRLVRRQPPFRRIPRATHCRP